MELMTISATRTEQFNIYVDRNGFVNYDLTISAKSAALVAVLALGTTVSEPLVSISSRIFEMPTPYVYISKNKSAIDEIPVAEKIHRVLSFYSLGKSHLCKIIGISRPTLYAWIGNSEPVRENFAKIEQLYTIASEFDVAGNKSIHHGFIDTALLGEDKSLYQLFVESKNLETIEIKKLIKIAFDKSISRENNIKNRRKSEFKIYHSNAEKELDLDGNI